VKRIQWYIVRRYVYGVAIAAGGILVYHEVIEPEALVVYLPLVLAMFNTKPPATPDEG
jgi:hypothetical protein